MISDVYVQACTEEGGGMSKYGVESRERGYVGVWGEQRIEIRDTEQKLAKL